MKNMKEVFIMQVRIDYNDLLFKTSTMTELEKRMFSDLRFSNSLTVSPGQFGCTVSGSSPDLYALLVELSFKFDIELL